MKVHEITKDTIFYANVNGQIIACKFTRLECYARNEVGGMEERFTYNLIYANGWRPIGGYYQLLPNIFETIDDCINNVNSLRDLGRLFINDIINIIMPNATMTGRTWSAWTRNEKTFNIELQSISMRCPACQGSYDVLNRKLVDDTIKYYSTKDECENNMPIKVFTF